MADYTSDRTGASIDTALDNADALRSAGLDDYEEGTWTPSITSTTGASPSGIVYTSQVGSYVKIGSMVRVGITLSFTANAGTALGRISLPFAIGGPSSHYPSSGIAALNLNFNGGTYVVTYSLAGNNYLVMTSNGSGVTQVNPETTTGNMSLRLSVVYQST